MITGTSISWAEHNYHTECFKCWLCETPIPLQGSFTKDVILNPLHMECFRCVRCGSSITESYRVSDGQPICVKDCEVRKIIFRFQGILCIIRMLMTSSVQNATRLLGLTSDLCLTEKITTKVSNCIPPPHQIK